MCAYCVTFLIVVILFTDVSSALFKPVTVEECKRYKGCFYTPAGCRGDDCQVVASWKLVNHPGVPEGYIEFELLGNVVESGYISLGFSEDRDFGNDGFVGCFISEITNKFEVRAGYHDRLTDEYMFYEGSDKGLLMTEGDDLGGDYSTLGGFIQCRFRRRVKPLDLMSQLKDLTLPSEYYLIVSRGSHVYSNRFGQPLPGKQIITDRSIKVTSRTIVNSTLRPAGSIPINPGPIPGSMTHLKDGTSTLMKTHGCLMVLAWVMCASIGLILSKYYKDIWPNSYLLRESVWFQSHRILQALCVSLTCIAIILAVIYCGGYSRATLYPMYIHPILGFIVFSLALLNAFVSLCRCSPSNPNRPWFNWIHFFIGTFAHVLSIPTMMLGLRMPAAGTGLLTIDYPMHILVFFVIFQFFVELSLEIHGCIYHERNKRRMNEYQRDPYNQKRMIDNPVPEMAGRRFKHFMIGLHATVASLVAVTLVIIIAVN